MRPQQSGARDVISFSASYVRACAAKSQFDRAILAKKSVWERKHGKHRWFSRLFNRCGDEIRRAHRAYHNFSSPKYVWTAFKSVTKALILAAMVRRIRSAISGNSSSTR